MDDFAFEPAPGQLEDSNIFRFMKGHGIQSLEKLSERAARDPAWFWEAVSQDAGIVWTEPYDVILDDSRGIAQSRWFTGGRTNIYLSSVARFARLSPDKVAYHFVSEDGQTSSITYAELDERVGRLANGLRSLGLKKGDAVGIFLPMIQEAVLAVLATARIGAISVVVFSGYGHESLRTRLQDSGARVLIACDGFDRRGLPVSQRTIVKDAVRGTGIRVVIVPYRGHDRYDRSDHVVPYGDLMDRSPECSTEVMGAEDPLFVLYTSGTTGRPKGTVQVHGGFSVFAAHQALYLTDMRSSDVLLWPADIGWITGLVWNVYGLLLAGATAVIYDGALDYPHSGRIWDILQRYGVTIFGTSPTAVRLLRKNGAEPPAHPDRIRLITTTGEPIDRDSWRWLFEKVGQARVPVVNLSGGTEVGGAILSVFAGMRLRPCTVGVPCPGMNLDVVDEGGRPVTGQKGYLVIRSPWPAMTRGLLNSPDTYMQTYWSRFENVWFHGDYVLRDNDGLWYMQGRADEIIKVSGHRLGTAEIEEGAADCGAVHEAAAVSVPDGTTGEAIAVFVVADGSRGLEAAVSDCIVQRIGKIARPKMVIRLSGLPQTRTGKIMRRLLRARLLGQPAGDLSALENPHVLDEVPPMTSTGAP